MRLVAALVSTVTALVLLASGSIALAAEQSVEDFVHGIYDTYLGEEVAGLGLGDESEVARYFDPELTALIMKDREEADRVGEVPILNGDPFIDAQDWQIDSLDISVEEASAGKAVAQVSFRNFGEEREIRLGLVELPQGWRIADIHASFGSLRELLSGPPG